MVELVELLELNEVGGAYTFERNNRRVVVRASEDVSRIDVD